MNFYVFIAPKTVVQKSIIIIIIIIIIITIIIIRPKKWTTSHLYLDLSVLINFKSGLQVSLLLINVRITLYTNYLECCSRHYLQQTFTLYLNFIIPSGIVSKFSF